MVQNVLLAQSIPQSCAIPPCGRISPGSPDLPITAVQRLPATIRTLYTVQCQEVHLCTAGVQVYLSIQVYSALCWIFVCYFCVLCAKYSDLFNTFVHINHI